MRKFTVIMLMVWADTASAHAGHLADLAGHDHWVAGAAIGLAVLAGLYGAVKGRKEKEDAESDASEPEEATA